LYLFKFATFMLYPLPNLINPLKIRLEPRFGIWRWGALWEWAGRPSSPVPP
jgi:hypothetical protein